MSKMIERNKQMYWPVEWSDVEHANGISYENANTPFGDWSISVSSKGVVTIIDPFENCFSYTSLDLAKERVQSEVNARVQRVLDGLVVV